ncbi:hypothetical protein ACXYTJ_16395 [Gilvimarinus sp. F26214L]|uniref:hypothetical protein n=1 Tax=Gilvimarinus sp. DZF01 TaxID=3461371 RepID=UPI0040454317
MTMFIFIGDMLVMLFMVCLVVWVGYKSSDEKQKQASAIPLNDEVEDLSNG